jgi:hypothetical protein
MCNRISHIKEYSTHGTNQRDSSILSQKSKKISNLYSKIIRKEVVGFDG